MMREGGGEGWMEVRQGVYSGSYLLPPHKAWRVRIGGDAEWSGLELELITLSGKSQRRNCVSEEKAAAHRLTELTRLKYLENSRRSGI